MLNDVREGLDLYIPPILAKIGAQAHNLPLWITITMTCEYGQKQYHFTLMNTYWKSIFFIHRR